MNLQIFRHLVFFLLLISIFGCSKTSERIIEDFSIKKTQYMDVVRIMNQDSKCVKNINMFINPNKLNDSTIKALNLLELGDISYVVLNKEKCGDYNGLSIYLKNNWHLDYYPCGLPDLKTGEHQKVGFIESWSLDKHWVLWVNRDYFG